MPNKNNLRLRKKRKDTHLNKIRKRNENKQKYEESILENTLHGQINKKFTEESTKKQINDFLKELRDILEDESYVIINKKEIKEYKDTTEVCIIS